MISVESLGKKYVIGRQRQPYSTLREALVRAAVSPFDWLRSATRKANLEIPASPSSKFEEFWALKDVSFEVKQGEVLGIIGRNGAGKSTLLKILSRITEPTMGRVRIRGRVASLLEVGTGFHPELTGRENIFLNGAILGMSKAEIKRKFDEIIAFAEIERFLDTPVKRYSSGMYVRLAFAVAAHLEPEILLVDEVLAVGDASFQTKCLGKMSDVASDGRTVLFVSHNMRAVTTLCPRAVLLDQGLLASDGNTAAVTNAYLATAGISASAILERNWDGVGQGPGNDLVRFHRVSVVQPAEAKTGTITMSTPFGIEVQYWNLRPDHDFHLDIVLYTEDGSPAFESYSVDQQPVPSGPPCAGLFRSTCFIPGDLLNEGTYRIRIQFIDQSSAPILNLNDALIVTVHDTDSRQLAWYGRCYGPVHPRLQWQTEFLRALSGESPELVTLNAS
ncbi:MAG TPA: ABC transporter ATP-binding protein [Blastocatellia bacterium]|nr:ABC transporter ATP-binding protein [Blastocatellia bacterium]